MIRASGENIKRRLKSCDGRDTVSPSPEIIRFIHGTKLIETCEWLYKETGNSAYRDLTVSWAKIHQRIKPYFSWAYAVEAKYTGSASDRFKALAIALYLDPNSERIAGFSAEDKAKARKWLEQNKPFQLKEEKPGPWIRNAGAEYMFRQKFL